MRWKQMLAVAGFLTLVAGCGQGEPESGDAGRPGAPGALEVLGTDRLAFEPSSLSAESGEITVALTSETGVMHDFVIEETDETVVLAPAGETVSGSVELDAGSYTFYCAVPGHRNAGMEGTLEVSG